MRCDHQNPAKAAELYEVELKLRVEELKQGYAEAEAAARNFTGEIYPTRGVPTHWV